MPFPWPLSAKLTFTDLNAAFATAYAQSQAALAAAQAAQAAAGSVVMVQGQARPLEVTLNWPASLVVAGTYVLAGTLPYGLRVLSVDASIGSAGGSILANFRANGVSLGSLSSVAVTQAAKTNFPAVAGPANPLTAGAGCLLDVVVTLTSGAPVDAYLCLNAVRTS